MCRSWPLSRLPWLAVRKRFAVEGQSERQSGQHVAERRTVSHEVKEIAGGHRRAKAHVGAVVAEVGRERRDAKRGLPLDSLIVSLDKRSPLREGSGRNALEAQEDRNPFALSARQEIVGAAGAQRPIDVGVDARKPREILLSLRLRCRHRHTLEKDRYGVRLSLSAPLGPRLVPEPGEDRARRECLC